jgi:Ca-activated chloride channel family protein
MRRPTIAAALLLTALTTPTAARAAATGALAGSVTDWDTSELLPGVTVVAMSPDLDGTRTAITDNAGRYRIDELAPGIYALSFYYTDAVVKRSGLVVKAGETTAVDVAIAASSGGELIVLSAPATSIDPDYSRNIPVALADELGGNREHYVEHRVNGWTRTAADRLSTFAADVDTASYAIARKKILAGQRPPEASVRVEEWLNYFRYDYAAPRGDRRFAVHLEAAPSPYADDRVLMRVGVQARATPAHSRKPANLVFLVDVSGSMDQRDKLPLARRALRMMVDRLDARDTVALVTYAGDTRIVLSPTSATNRGAIVSAIAELSPGGSTAMGAGLELAYRVAGETLSADSISRVIVLSDGDANVGDTSHGAMLETIARQVERGVTLTTLGFGVGNYQDHRMEQLADRGNGSNHYIDDLLEARRVLVEQLGSTLEVVAKDVKIQVELDPAVVDRYRLIGYDNRDIADRDFRDDKIDAGEIGAGHAVTAIYELELTAGAPAGDLAVVRVRAKAPRGERASESVHRFGSSRLRSSFAAASEGFRFAAAVAGAAEILRGSPDAEGWTLAEAIRVAREASRRDQADRRECVELLERLEDIAENRRPGRWISETGYMTVGGGIGGLVVRDVAAPTRVTAMPALRLGLGRGSTSIALELGGSRGAAEATAARGATPVGDSLSIYSVGAVISHRLLRGAALQPVGGLGLETLIVSPSLGSRRVALAAVARVGLEMVHRAGGAELALGLDLTGHLPVAESELMPMQLSSLISVGSYLDVRL